MSAPIAISGLRSSRTPWLWMSAAWVALTLLLRIARGEVVLLSSHGAPVIRLVAVVLVFLAGCAEKLRPAGPQEHGSGDMSQGSGAAAPTPAPEPVIAAPQDFPDDLDDAALERAHGWIPGRNLWRYFAGETTPGELPALAPAEAPAIAEASAAFAALVQQHVTRVRAGELPGLAELVALLDGAEAVHLYDEWLAGHLWRHARSLRPASPQLLARLERHLRICHALVLAEAVTGPIEFSAWRSKAAPPRGWSGLRVPAGLAAAARAEFLRGADAGAWEDQAVLALTVTQGEVTLLRRGGSQRVGAGQALRLRRLDVVRADASAVLQHATLGPLRLPTGAELTAWTVDERLEPAARTRLRARVDAAAAGDAQAQAELAELLPAAQAPIREVVAASPQAPGAPALRLLLTTFDE